MSRFIRSKKTRAKLSVARKKWNENFSLGRSKRPKENEREGAMDNAVAFIPPPTEVPEDLLKEIRERLG